MYNKIKGLEVVVDLVDTQCETSNKQVATSEKLRIRFCKGSWCPLRRNLGKDINMNLLSRACGWKMSVEHTTSVHFPLHITQTNQRPEIMMWSYSKKCVLVLLSIPWGENTEEAHKLAESEPVWISLCGLRGEGLVISRSIEVGCWVLNLGLSIQNKSDWLATKWGLKTNTFYSSTSFQLDLVHS